RVRAAAAEAGRDGDLLLDLNPPARLGARNAGQFVERRTHQRVLGEALDPKLGRFLELDPVDEVDALEDGQDFVLSVVAQRAYDQSEVDLRRGGSTAHRNASLSARNSAGASASARVSARWPIAA